MRIIITRTIANLIDYHVDDDNCFDDFDATTASLVQLLQKKVNFTVRLLEMVTLG